MTRKIDDKKAWIDARLAHLEEEKAFTRQRDALSAKRRELPWLKIDEAYTFDTNDGPKTLAELFGDQNQLIIYHFMYGPEWEQGCPSCSFWADNFNGVDVHLKHRDITLLCVSRAPLATLNAYKKRMGWDFEWVSSENNTFNYDFFVSFTDEQQETGEPVYNFGTSTFPSSEAPGASAFFKDDNGDIYLTYATFSRGLDMLNGAYHYMDIAPKGRDEKELSYSMAWLKRRDQYED